jgi:hypothetical protein
VQTRVPNYAAKRLSKKKSYSIGSGDPQCPTHQELGCKFIEREIQAGKECQYVAAKNQQQINGQNQPTRNKTVGEALG